MRRREPGGARGKPHPARRIALGGAAVDRRCRRRGSGRRWRGRARAGSGDPAGFAAIAGPRSASAAAAASRGQTKAQPSRAPAATAPLRRSVRARRTSRERRYMPEPSRGAGPAAQRGRSSAGRRWQPSMTSRPASGRPREQRRRDREGTARCRCSRPRRGRRARVHREGQAGPSVRDRSGGHAAPALVLAASSTGAAHPRPSRRGHEDVGPRQVALRTDRAPARAAAAAAAGPGPDTIPVSAARCPAAWRAGGVVDQRRARPGPGARRSTTSP